MSDIKILLVDDSKEILLLLKENFEREGYKVDTASDGQIAIDLFNKNKYHLVILDISMPKIDGIEVCRKIRTESNIPIILLTAKNEEIDKVIGLKIGADDYVTKPFGMKELLARVDAQLRRYLILNDKLYENKNTKILVFGDLKIDFARYTVYKGDKEINLTAKEFELLKFFATNPNQVFTKEQIFKEVWHDDYLKDDNTVMVHIRRLRKKIEIDSKNPSYIQTVWGVGYKFTGK
ncbi:response regulator transcription factor [Caminicella sporogenes]|uniref:response regulator transcription factor n=1 Tax=Caminicella sporogenes TaxID=166485 RepID=UPI00254045C1|nr:response regulator transcription factor [Caminicella sporogenes]WIF94164.1 response regulator transcription factor [Caminicella sporogenes]